MAKKIKSPVSIRTRKGAKGHSIYLDIYYQGKRSYQYLNLYLSDAKTIEAKVANEKYMEIARQVKVRIENEILQGTYGLVKKDVDFIEFFKKHKGRFDNYTNCEHYLEQFFKGRMVTISGMDTEMLEKFHKFLTTKIQESTAYLYMRAILCVLNKAEKYGYKTNKKGFSMTKPKSAEREYLTIDEIRPIYQKYVHSDKDEDQQIKAFLFSCLTGLRLSDICKLAWKNIRKEGEYYRIIFEQQKTSQQEYLDINQQAYELLGDHDIPDDEPIFRKDVDKRRGHKLRKKLEEFGITKHISFHCARHSFAIMMLELDTDIYTVSKLLGHADISTTLIYARVVDKKKREAINKIPNLIV